MCFQTGKKKKCVWRTLKGTSLSHLCFNECRPLVFLPSFLSQLGRCLHWCTWSSIRSSLTNKLSLRRLLRDAGHSHRLGRLHHSQRHGALPDPLADAPQPHPQHVHHQQRDWRHSDSGSRPGQRGQCQRRAVCPCCSWHHVWPPSHKIKLSWNSGTWWQWFYIIITTQHGSILHLITLMREVFCSSQTTTVRRYFLGLWHFGWCIQGLKRARASQSRACNYLLLKEDFRSHLDR